MDIVLMKQFISYNPDTGEMTWKQVMSNRAKVGSPCGANVDSKGYGRVCFNGKQYRAHRVAWALHYGFEPEGILDHVNGDRLDNRISNLRQVDLSQNARNSGLSKNNTSGHKGVTWHQKAGKWVAQISMNKKNKYLGLFDDKKLAMEARDNAEKKYFGEHRRVLD